MATATASARGSATADDAVTHAREIAMTVRETGAKLVCIDFDATFVSVHTGGAWHRSPEELQPHVRALFLALVPLLVRDNVTVAIVTFSPQLELIRAVLHLCFSSYVTDRLIIRCDDTSWRLDKTERIEFLPMWMVSSVHFDRAFKLAYVISAARQASQERGEIVRNRDTILIDDDEQNIRIAIDNGITGIYYEPHGAEPRELCRRIRKLHVTTTPPVASASSSGPLSTPVKLPLHQTPCKRKTVRLLQTPEAPPRSSGRGPPSVRLQGTPVIASMPRSKKFSLCTPSPVMKLKCTVDMGRPRPKKAMRLRQCPRNIEEDMHELHLQQAMTGAPASAPSLHAQQRAPTPPASAPGRLQMSRSSPPPPPFLSTSPRSPDGRFGLLRSFLETTEDIEA